MCCGRLLPRRDSTPSESTLRRDSTRMTSDTEGGGDASMHRSTRRWLQRRSRSSAAVAHQTRPTAACHACVCSWLSRVLWTTVSILPCSTRAHLQAITSRPSILTPRSGFQFCIARRRLHWIPSTLMKYKKQRHHDDEHRSSDDHEPLTPADSENEPMHDVESDQQDANDAAHRPSPPPPTMTSPLQLALQADMMEFNDGSERKLACRR
jgi:hypothetical protein